MSAWPEDRRREYVALAELVREVRRLNKGSGDLQRIERCIAIAEALSRDDLAALPTPKVGLMTWLHSRVMGLPMTGSGEGPAPVLWALTYMGEVIASDCYDSADQARDMLDLRNRRYPDGAALRAVVPLYAAPVTQEAEA